MTKEDTGVTEEHVADAQPQGQKESLPPAQDVQPDDQEINWKQANETMAEQKKKLEALEQQNQLLQQQQALIQANAMQQTTPVAQPVDPMAQLSDDDILTGADFKKAIESQRKEFKKAIQEQQNAIQQMATRSQYPDYEEVVGYTLRQAQNDPNLANAIASSSNPQLLAYQLGKANPEYTQAKQAKKQSAQAQRIVENAQKPGSVNNASTGSSALSKADWFMSCSDNDFEQHIAKIKGGL